MTGRNLACLAAPLVLAAAAASCGSDSSPREDGGRDAQSADSEPGEAEAGEGGVSDGGGAAGGPLIFVTAEMHIVLDRLCDLDGDSVPDNSIADLGTTSAQLYAAALDSVLAATIDDGTRPMVHVPWVDDHVELDASGAVLIVYSGVDTDYPENVDDDFSGEERFFVDADYLDPCGEPSYVTPGLTVADGELSAEAGEVPFHLGEGLLTLSGAVIGGAIDPGGAAVEMTVCGYASVQEMGAERSFDESGGLSMLEMLLQGGAAVGLPTLPGLAPDVDVDGDGLERFFTDADGRLSQCVDGDGTPVVGPDCYADPRFADGISLNISMSGVPARCAGPEPGWETRVPDTCERWPPEESLFDGAIEGEGLGECADRDERCDPLVETPCCDPEDRCRGVYHREYLCLSACEPARCDFGELAGQCRSQGSAGRVCMPVYHWPSTQDCEVGVEGCATPYGETEGTSCVQLGADWTNCLEPCDTVASGCEPGYTCIPLVRDPDGICVPPPG